jgi:dTDP-4-dehydrorhamnose reductase
MAERRNGRFKSEIHHLCAAGHTSWFGFAQRLFDRWRVVASHSPLALRTLEAIPSADYPTPARRPLNSRLDCTRFEDRFGLALPAWEQGLECVLQELAETISAR